MFSAGQLKALHARKLLLLNESALYRRSLVDECTQLQQRLEWVDRGIKVARRVLPFCMIAIPLLRLWRIRPGAGAISTLRRIAKALPVARRLVTLWQSVQR